MASCDWRSDVLFRSEEEDEEEYEEEDEEEEEEEEEERRSVRRYPFIAAVEITELSSGDRRSGRTSDLSLGGSYIDMLNPFPRGTLVRLRIFNDKGVLEARGRVISSHAGFWMGIGFTHITPDQRSVLKGSLTELESLPGHTSPLP
jgi:hypothetical protein